MHLLFANPEDMFSPFEAHFMYICMQEMIAMVRLCRCTGSSEPSLLTSVISAKIYVLAYYYMFDV